jgi:hypothetical protein
MFLHAVWYHKSKDTGVKMREQEPNPTNAKNAPSRLMMMLRMRPPAHDKTPIQVLLLLLLLMMMHYVLSSLLVSFVEDDLSSGSNVHLHSRLRFRRPATGVSGHESSLSESDSEESRFSPVRGDLMPGDPSKDEKDDEVCWSDGETRGEFSFV